MQVTHIDEAEVRRSKSLSCSAVGSCPFALERRPFKQGPRVVFGGYFTGTSVD